MATWKPVLKVCQQVRAPSRGSQTCPGFVAGRSTRGVALPGAPSAHLSVELSPLCGAGVGGGVGVVGTCDEHGSLPPGGPSACWIKKVKWAIRAMSSLAICEQFGYFLFQRACSCPELASRLCSDSRSSRSSLISQRPRFISTKEKKRLLKNGEMRP